MKKKVLFVINTMGIAGAEKALCSLLSILDYQEYEVSLLSLFNRGEMFRNVPSQVHIINQQPKCKSVMDLGGMIALARFCGKALLHEGYLFRKRDFLKANLREQIKGGHLQIDKLCWDAISDVAVRLDEKFDLAIAFLEGGATYYVSKHVKARTKISFLHVDYGRSKYIADQDRVHFAAMKKIMCVSAGVEESFWKAFPEFKKKTDIIPNIILKNDIKRFAVGTGFVDNFDGIRLLTIGRLHYQKAYDIAIDAMAILKKRGRTDIHWYVIGDGSEKGALKRHARAKGVADRFIFLGAKKNPYPYLEQCSIYMQMTRFEGWSIAVAEALVLKKLIIASDRTGNREQIQDGQNGILIKLSAENIADAVEEIIRNEALRQAIASELQKHEFNMEQSIQKVNEMMRYL